VPAAETITNINNMNKRKILTNNWIGTVIECSFMSRTRRGQINELGMGIINIIKCVDRESPTPDHFIKNRFDEIDWWLKNRIIIDERINESVDFMKCFWRAVNHVIKLTCSQLEFCDQEVEDKFKHPVMSFIPTGEHVNPHESRWEALIIILHFWLQNKEDGFGPLILHPDQALRLIQVQLTNHFYCPPDNY